MNDAVLVLDIGNTTVTAGVALSGRVSGMRTVPTRQCSATGIRQFVSRIASGVTEFRGSAIASVVPNVTPRWRAAVKRATGTAPIVVSHRTTLNIDIAYSRPSSIGADRLAAASGAVDRHGAPIIIADFGTALTIDAVTKQGTYVGGVIAPGLPAMTDYLAEKTALLPKIKLREDAKVIGASTREAMQSGARFGYRGMVKEIIAEICKDKRFSRATLCATGGHAHWILKGSGLKWRFDPDLTLHGLSVIYDLNC